MRPHMSTNMSVRPTLSQLGATWNSTVCVAYDASNAVQAAVCIVHALPFSIQYVVLWIDQCVSVVCCSSLLLQQLEPVLGIVRAAVAGINSLTVICEKHQVLPTKRRHVCMYEPLTPENKNPEVKNSADVSYPITHSGDDGVQVLDFTFQQHHPGTLSAVLVRMVQHHIQKVPELGCDARVLER